MISDNPTGPAPDGVFEAAQPVETEVMPVDESDREGLRARFQPWVDSGGTFVAWEIGAEHGHLGTCAFPEDAVWPDQLPVEQAEAVVWLGEYGYPTGDGRYRDWVALHGDVATGLYEGILQCRGAIQSPSAGLTPLAEDEYWGVDADNWETRITAERADKLADPAPVDAADIGDRYEFAVLWWRGETVCVCQAWRPLRGTSAYVAWTVAPPPSANEDRAWDTIEYGGTLDWGTHGILNGKGPVVYLGRRPKWGWVYYFHLDTADAFDGLVADVQAFQSDHPSTGFRTFGNQSR